MTTETSPALVDVPAEAIPSWVDPTPDQWRSISRDVQQIVSATRGRDAQAIAQAARWVLQNLATLHESRLDLGLSITDLHVLWLMSIGYSDTRIATRSGVAHDYITHTLLPKMDVTNQAEAVSKAFRYGFLV